MYIHIASFDGTTLRLARGPGPLLIGHYSSAAEWRITSSILASVASHVPDSMVAVIADVDAAALLAEPIARGVPWRHLTDREYRDTDRGGWVWLKDGERALFVPSDRDEIEDCVYRTFSSGTFLITPRAVRRFPAPFGELERALKEAALVEIDAAYFDIDIIINDQTLAQIVMTRVSRIVADFDQL